MLREFTTLGQGAEDTPRSTITIDTSQRKLIRGETFAFKDPDGDFFLIRVDDVRAANKAAGRDAWGIIGKVIAWRPVLH
jgi:hypothetical protein